ncbi:MAG: PilZ domain-containing protein [Candidatus Eremiobacterota bacterium]
MELLREKRRQPRQAAEQKVSLRVGQENFPALCIEASAGGMRLEASARSPLKVGERFWVAGPDSATREGRVAWLRAIRGSGRVLVGVELKSTRPTDSVQSERRSYVRVPVDVYANLRQGSHSHPVRLLDLSLRGARLAVNDRLKSGDCVLELPHAGLTVEAQVLDNRGSLARLSIPTLDRRTQDALASYLTGFLRRN